MGREDITSVKEINIQFTEVPKTLHKLFKVRLLDLIIFKNLANVNYF